MAERKVSRGRSGLRVGLLGLSVWFLMVAGCSWDGLRRGMYEGAVVNEQRRQNPHGRPPDEPPPTFEQYEHYRTTDHR